MLAHYAMGTMTSTVSVALLYTLCLCLFRQQMFDYMREKYTLYIYMYMLSIIHSALLILSLSAFSPPNSSVGLIMAHKHARLIYQPLGVVAAIVSWNYPFHNTYGPIISALFAGNAIVLKVHHMLHINSTIIICGVVVFFVSSVWKERR